MKISVVVPLYNEEECVRPMVEELMPIVLGLDPDCEVLLVDDGSKDQTPARVADVQSLWPRHIRYLRFAKNCGQTAALDAGFKHARGEMIVIADGDMQVDPADIPMMIAQMKDYDVVHGWRWQRKDTAWKRVQTRIANRVRNWLTKSDVHDTGCPLKVFRREVVQSWKLFTGMHRFFITLARMEGYRTLEVKVRHRDRVAGQSKYSMWNRVFRALRDLFAVRWMMARHFKYDVTEMPFAGTKGKAQSAPQSRDATAQ